MNGIPIAIGKVFAHVGTIPPLFFVSASAVEMDAARRRDRTATRSLHRAARVSQSVGRSPLGKSDRLGSFRICCSSKLSASRYFCGSRVEDQPSVVGDMSAIRSRNTSSSSRRSSGLSFITRKPCTASKACKAAASFSISVSVGSVGTTNEGCAPGESQGSSGEHPGNTHGRCSISEASTLSLDDIASRAAGSFHDPKPDIAPQQPAYAPRPLASEPGQGA